MYKEKNQYRLSFTFDKNDSLNISTNHFFAQLATHYDSREIDEVNLIILLYCTKVLQMNIHYISRSGLYGTIPTW